MLKNRNRCSKITILPSSQLTGYGMHLQTEKEFKYYWINHNSYIASHLTSAPATKLETSQLDYWTSGYKDYGSWVIPKANWGFCVSRF